MFSEVKILYDKHYSVYIFLPDTQLAKVCGLCEHYANDTNKEISNTHGKIIDNIADFVNSWVDPDPEEQTDISVNTWDVHPCGKVTNREVCNTFPFPC